METVSSWRSHGGTQGVYRHASSETATDMTFSVFVPDHLPTEKLPVVWYLSGLTCNHSNVTEKGEYRAACEALGLIEASFPADMTRQAIMGHSMGGHGALTIALRNPDRFRSVSAFAPIVAPLHCPWGEKALGGYLGDDRDSWREYDACALIEDGARVAEILVDQGGGDNFLTSQLKPHLLSRACDDAGIALTLRMEPVYDHSYYFISTFMADHLRWHAARLNPET